MHCIFATITPKPQYFELAKQSIINILEQTRQEKGCLQFVVHTNHSKTELFLYEQWANEVALSFHYEQAYTKQVFQEYEEWLEKPVVIKTLSLLA